MYDKNRNGRKKQNKIIKKIKWLLRKNIPFILFVLFFLITGVMLLGFKYVAV